MSWRKKKTASSMILVHTACTYMYIHTYNIHIYIHTTYGTYNVHVLAKRSALLAVFDNFLNKIISDVYIHVLNLACRVHTCTAVHMYNIHTCGTPTFSSSVFKYYIIYDVM